MMPWLSLVRVTAIVILFSFAACWSAQVGGDIGDESHSRPPVLNQAQSQPKPVQIAGTASGIDREAGQPEEISLLEKNTLLAIYGRGFGRAPILGRLGTYQDIDEMAKDIHQWVEPIKRNNDNKGVVPAIHLIYAMAIPCQPESNCLMYLNGKADEIVKRYIEPAAERGWAVILDTQLGRSNPVEQVKRMIDQGYLKYDNVHVGIDPEFRSHPGHERPGIPIGTVQAAQINDVQRILDNYVREQRLRTKKILIVHQFGDANVNDGVPFMIENKKSLKTFDHVDLVIDMDGFGQQEIKVFKYNKITDSKKYPFIRFRGIKVFYPNAWEKHGHYDKPPLDVDQVFGNKPVKRTLKIESKPDVVIIA